MYCSFDLVCARLFYTFCLQSVFDFVIKRYDYGKLTCHIHDLDVGSTIEIRGPIGNFKYGCNQHSHITMIAAGTGITPMFQVMEALLADEGDQTEMTLIYQV